LADKYTLDTGRVYLTAIQALVRLPLEQIRRDRAAGLTTGGFISGYRGSPLGGYDEALWKAQSLLKAHNIHFQPGLNEELAATSVWGAQQLALSQGATAQGVFGLWYGKGPGVDRAIDAFKHANLAGASALGGALVLAGDDHGCVSSTLPHQSEYELIGCMIPVFAPATVQDYLEMGLAGIGLSRYSGCWVAIKATSETAEASASIAIGPDRPHLILPIDFELPPGGLNIRFPDAPMAQEARLHGPRMEAVAAYARVNGFDRVMWRNGQPRLGIMASGKGWLDLRQALNDLKIDEHEAARLGIALMKVGMSWPLESIGARRFAEGLSDLLIVEEKRPLIEEQLTRILYNMPADRRPLVVGKRDETGAPLLPTHGEIGPAIIAKAIVARLERLGADVGDLRRRVALLESFSKPAGALSLKEQRSAYFCSGCPHNTSTVVPEGSRAGGGIGCHTLAVFMNRSTPSYTQMGGEGAPWIGQAPFTTEKHIFQNLGDGTYAHSGLLAIRAAAAAGVNITYKILFNDAVAMTGGQPVEGGLTVAGVARQLHAEGAKKIVVVSDEPDKYPLGTDFPPGITFHHRRDLDAVQRDLREVEGLSILIYDQTCAAEKRRRRKRGTFPDPAVRAFINDAVCEGCGDCSRTSNCISVLPLETEFGRKRAIDQSNCNKDMSCVEGFCPSFVTVHGGQLRKPPGASRPDKDSAAKPPGAPTAAQTEAEPDPVAGLPEPALSDNPSASILITGIGGTGVITIGALIGMAAHIEGKACTVHDNTGLSQKNGAVTSHVRIASDAEDLTTTRIGPGGATLLLACDMVVADSPAALTCLAPGVTRAVVNAYLQPTAGFVQNPDMRMDSGHILKNLRSTLGGQGMDTVDATRLATALLGDAIASNPFILGFAWQKGLLPLSQASLLRAIELNGIAVEANKRAFAWGRRAAHDPAAVEARVAPRKVVPLPTATPDLAALVDRRAAFLTDYQNAAYAQRYRDLVARIAQAEQVRVGKSDLLARAVAEGAFKLMAYKDEYEVARLYTNGDFAAKLKERFDGNTKVKIHLAPPLFARRDPVTGHLTKRAYGPWVLKAFHVLAALRGLRGTGFDVFGYTKERRQERQLVEDYVRQMDALAGDLSPANHEIAVALAKLPERMKGYGHIKEANIAAAKKDEAALLVAFRDPGKAKAAE
jgi:indolepyruvate ferredoxin oxidoreductase